MTCAHDLEAIDLIRPGTQARAFQASQQAWTISS
jgi:hypothetical protein